MHHARLLVGSLALFFATNIFAAADIGPNVGPITGKIPKNTTGGTFTLDVVVENIAKADLTGAVGSEPWKRLKVYLKAISDNTPLPASTADGTNFEFYYEERDTYKTEAMSSATTTELYKVTFYLTVSAIASKKTTGIAELLKKEGSSISGVVDYDGGSGKTDSEGNTFTITQSTSVANAAPSEFTIQPGHKSLTVVWEYESTIAFKGTSVTTGTPDGATVVALPNTQALELPAFVFNTDPNQEDSPTTCTFTPLTGASGSCISCGTNEGNAYIDVTQLSNVAGASFNSVQSGEADLSNLEVGVPHAVFIFYQPSGVVRSTCQLGTAIKTTSYAEAMGEPEAELKDPRCFVATAAYGKSDDRQVLALRWLRSNVMRHLPLGPDVISAYYRISPPIARVIAEHAWLRQATRIALAPAVALAEGLQWLMAN